MLQKLPIHYNVTKSLSFKILPIHYNVKMYVHYNVHSTLYNVNTGVVHVYVGQKLFTPYILRVFWLTHYKLFHATFD
jgi:hypothetical protein